ncbi:MAG: hypothetical protein WBB28_00750, partial [Crinalium sp.]
MKIWLQQTRTQVLITQEKTLPHYGYNDNWQFLVIICHLTLYCHKASLVDNFIEDPDFVAIAPNFDAFAL